MAVHKILRMGHPTLRQVARALTDKEILSEDIRRLVADMEETLHDYGGVGLAAPQVNVPIRLAIIEIAGGDSRYGDIPSLPLTVFVNPTVEVIDGEPAGFWEGCLSVPGLRGFVERPQSIKVRAKNLQLEEFELHLTGFLATVFQHEFDHLDGVLYIDRLQDPAKLVFEEEFSRYVLADAQSPDARPDANPGANKESAQE